MTNLQNTNILLFIPRGKGIYGTGVCAELEKRGAKVVVYDERPSTSTFSKVLIRLAQKYFSFYFNAYINKIISNNLNASFDYILVVRGEAFTNYAIECLRKTYPAARLILYLWDSLNSIDKRDIFSGFDKVFSYDQIDVDKNPGLKHRPQFFLDNYKKIEVTSPREIDVTFIGTAHNDRYYMLKKLENEFNKTGIRTFLFFFFPSRLLYIRKKLLDKSFRKAKIREFSFKMLDAEQVASYFAKSRVVIDIQDPMQKGITMRTIEVMGSKRKLITTNETVKSFDFYNENNIMVIDRTNPIIDPSFINSPYFELDKIIYEKYTLQKWIDDIFEIE